MYHYSLEQVYPIIFKGSSMCLLCSFNAQCLKEEKWQSACGNPFSQCLHDGGTFSNHVKHHAIGNFFVDVKCRKNHVFTIGFARSLTITDESVALLLEKMHRSRTNLTFEEAVGYTMADAAAKGVAKVVEHDSEV